LFVLDEVVKKRIHVDTPKFLGLMSRMSRLSWAYMPAPSMLHLDSGGNRTGPNWVAKQRGEAAG
jgi:hypothetical protein